MQARIATYGGIVTSITVPDRAGHFADVVLGYDTLYPYLHNKPYFGALIGRYANRIAGGLVRLNGKTFHLSLNERSNSLHGGTVGFDQMLWTVQAAHTSAEGPQLRLSYVSQNGEEGYPGTLSVTAAYTLLQENALRLEFTATTDQITVINLTGHSYFNLAGRGDVLDHYLQINADRFTPVSVDLIPTGELRAVSRTPFDFRKAARMGARIDEDDEQLRYSGGYDHNWVLEGKPRLIGLDAIACDPVSGRVLQVWSDQPGLQFYSGNFLDGTHTGRGGWRYERRHGFCLEPQQFPDAPNQTQFPSTVLAPGDRYHRTIVYRFF